MNAKEHAEKLAAARAELARLEAIVPEKERPGMVLPEQSEPIAFGWHLRDEIVRMVDKYQHEAYADAFLTMLLMRAQKGIVNPADNCNWFIHVGDSVLAVWCSAESDYLESFMFPAYQTEADACAAIAAVGEDRIIRCAKWLAGCV